MAKKKNKTSVKSHKAAVKKTAPNKALIGVIGVILLAAAMGVFLLTGRNSAKKTGGTTGKSEVAVSSISYEANDNHIHGMVYDYKENKVKISTHYGMFSATEDGKLFQIGDSRDDYMGLSVHPKDPQILYAGGHPQFGGNLGVVKSEDGGFSWSQIYSGPGGEAVDFHVMAISPADPQTFYAIYHGAFYRSTDGGNKWETLNITGLTEEPISLMPDPLQKNVVFAAAPGGVWKSADKGLTWSKISSTPLAGGAALDPTGKIMFAYTAEQGLSRSQDLGKTWKPAKNGMSLASDEVTLYYGFDPENAGKLYVSTTKNRIFVTEDGGGNWKLFNG